VRDPLAELLADAAGFPSCGRCKYVETGTPELCFACARRSMENLAPFEQRCPVCDQPVGPGDARCGNPTCNRSDLQFEWNWAIAMKSGPLDRVIRLYKYEGQHGWAKIFGRILLGFLEQHRDTFREFGFIVASPTVAGTFEHAREVLREAAYEDLFSPDSWPFDVVGAPAIIRTREVGRFAGKSYQQRRALADSDLFDSIQITEPQKIAGRQVLVYDDVFTTGLTLQTVATRLRASGATAVCGVSLVRAPFRGRHS